MSLFTKIRDVALTGASLYAGSMGVPIPVLAAGLPSSVTGEDSAPAGSPAPAAQPAAAPAGKPSAGFVSSVTSQPYFVPALIALVGLLGLWVVVRGKK